MLFAPRLALTRRYHWPILQRPSDPGSKHVQNVPRHALSEPINSKIVNVLIVTDSLEAIGNIQLTCIHLFQCVVYLLHLGVG